MKTRCGAIHPRSSVVHCALSPMHEGAHTGGGWTWFGDALALSRPGGEEHVYVVRSSVYPDGSDDKIEAVYRRQMDAAGHMAHLRRSDRMTRIEKWELK